VAAFDADAYRQRAERFLGELDLEHYRHYAGLKADCDSSSIYGRYAELFTRETVDTLHGLYLEAVDDDARRRSSYLLNFATDGFLGEATKELSDEIANLEGRATIEVDGEEIGYRFSSVVQANEADGDRRRRIHEARLQLTVDTLNPRYEERWRTLHDLVRELGYTDYRELYSQAQGVDFGLLRAEMETFLQETEGLYQRTLDRVVREKLGFGREELHVADLPFLIRAPEYDHVFKEDGLVPTFAQVLADMGVDLAAQSNVHVDAEARELKSPRAFCSPVRVPDEIYLVVMPKGGQDDYQALLHEGGHTEHFAHTRPDLPFEYRYLGDNAVTEGFAFILDHLVLNAGWLEAYLDYADSQGFLKFAYLVELYFLRRYAGKLAYETELHVQKGPLGHMAERYHALLSDAVQVDTPAANFLVDVDDGFYSANYVRAWMLEGAFRMLLQDRFGMEWFREPEAAAWLKELWSHGQAFTADQLLLKNGGGRLDTGPLRLHLQRVLGR
jgi:hypothetical protein